MKGCYLQMKMLERTLYLDKVKPFINQNLVKVLIGIRRSGKTILLSQIRDFIITGGVLKDNTLLINLESRQYKNLKNADNLYDYIISYNKNIKGKLYIFLDEIQEVEEWQTIISSLLVDIECDIYISGSNAKLLSGELATYLAGRYVKFDIYPFTLKEIQEFYNLNEIPYNREDCFIEYLKYGGLPQRLMLPDENSIITYLEDVYDSIVIKDIII